VVNVLSSSGTAVTRYLLPALLLAVPALADEKPPASPDPQLVVEQFAAAPDIVHPIAMHFDSTGRQIGRASCRERV